MKKIAIVTVAVLALGITACKPASTDNNAANETAVENNAETDVNAAISAYAQPSSHTPAQIVDVLQVGYSGELLNRCYSRGVSVAAWFGITKKAS